MRAMQPRNATTVVRALLTALVVSGYGGVLWLLMTEQRELSVQLERILTLLLGTLTAILQMVIQFWFGTSQGSAEKSAEINERSKS
jgi:hypothetical protein